MLKSIKEEADFIQSCCVDMINCIDNDIEVLSTPLLIEILPKEKNRKFG